MPMDFRNGFIYDLLGMSNFLADYLDHTSWVHPSIILYILLYINTHFIYQRGHELGFRNKISFKKLIFLMYK